MVGAVERDAILNGSEIRPGDAIIGIPSNGLHTNGYSLVRHALGLDDDPTALNEVILELGDNVTLGDSLLMPHPSYVEVVRPVLPMLKGMAHITGGGIIENIPRVLPEGTAARFDSSSWRVPPIFTLLQERAARSPVMRCTACSTWESGWRWCATWRRSDAVAILRAPCRTAVVVGEVSSEINGDNQRRVSNNLQRVNCAERTQAQMTNDSCN